MGCAEPWRAPGLWTLLLVEACSEAEASLAWRLMVGPGWSKKDRSRFGASHRAGFLAAASEASERPWLPFGVCGGQPSR